MVINCLKAEEERIEMISHKKQGMVLFHDNMKVDVSDITESFFAGKTDIQSTFCLVPLASWCWAWLVMCARNPKTQTWLYFIDKC